MGASRRSIRRACLTRRTRSIPALSRLARRFSREREDPAAVEAAVATVLAERGPTGCNDPVFVARMLRECLAPTRFETTEPSGVGSDRFRAVLRTLEDPPVVPQPVASQLALAADALSFRREAVTEVVDVGLAARIQSSFGRKGRLLSTIARITRPASILELGTAFGMSAAFLAKAAPDARLVTLDPSAVHARVARELLESVEAGAVEVLEQGSEEAVAEVRERLEKVDLLFHDARHTREAYVQDFASYEPLLAPGAVVLYDDIDFRYPSGPDTHTRAGWEEVTRHPRVRSAVEIDGSYGLLEVR